MSVEIHHQLERSRSLNRQVRWFDPAEDSVHIFCRPQQSIGTIDPVSDERTGGGVWRESKDRWQEVRSRLLDDQIAMNLSNSVWQRNDAPSRFAANSAMARSISAA